MLSVIKWRGPAIWVDLGHSYYISRWSVSAKGINIVVKNKIGMKKYSCTCISFLYNKSKFYDFVSCESSLNWYLPYFIYNVPVWDVNLTM